MGRDVEEIGDVPDERTDVEGRDEGDPVGGGAVSSRQGSRGEGPLRSH